MTIPHRAWLEIDTQAVRHNVGVIRKLANHAKIMAVIKSNAYGLGAPQIAHAVRSAGVDYLGIGNVEEALILQGYGISGPFFLLEPPLPEDLPAIVDNNYIQAITGLEAARRLSKQAAASRKEAEVHLNVNVGMNRLGLSPAEVLENIDELFNLPGLRFSGIFAHFSSADEQDKTPTVQQYEKFSHLLTQLQKKGITFPLRHIANSATLLDLPQYSLDMVRTGILLYGIFPSLSVRQDPSLLPALSVKAKVAHLFKAAAGETVSYGRSWTVEKAGVLATLPIGTADGVSSSLSNKGKILIQGKPFPIAGKICMDLLMCYLGESCPKIGDEAVLIGKQHNEQIRVSDWVRWGNLDPHEILTGLGGKLPKLYL